MAFPGAHEPGPAAACRRVDPDLFFPPGYSREHQPRVRQAKAICLQCPVTAQCLALALQAGEPTGIWGGCTPAERLRLRVGSSGR